ncbi:MAG: cytochrome P450 [Acidimicrobiales bacterium]
MPPDRTNVILGASIPSTCPTRTDIVTAPRPAGGDLAALMQRVAESKKGGDGTDLTSMLINAKGARRRAEPVDLASFFILLVAAGNETTQRHRLGPALPHAEPTPTSGRSGRTTSSGSPPPRWRRSWASPVTYMRRTATQDTVVGGQQIKAGDKLCLFYLSANRDEDHFVDPYRFDVLRSPNNHVGFGGPGPHYCLGAHLARREITVMFRELFHRLPGIVATGAPQPLQASFIHGVKHLAASA